MLHLTIDELTAFKKNHMADMNEDEQEVRDDTEAFIDSLMHRESRIIKQQKVIEHENKRPNSRPPAEGDVVRVVGLEKTTQYNGLQGTITCTPNEQAGRYSVKVNYDKKIKTLVIKAGNVME